MSFEAPVQRVPVRGPIRTLALLVGALALASLLVWRPWGGASREAGPGTGPAVATPTAAAEAEPTPRSLASGSPAATPQLYAEPPPADQFHPTWSIVGVRDLAPGGYSIAQIDVHPGGGPPQNLSSAEVCARARERAPDVALLPGWTLRLFGAVELHAGRGWVQLTSIDASNRLAFAARVTYPPGTEDLAVALFGLTDQSLWPPGAYRFYAVDDEGVGRYLYACLAG